MTARHRVYCGPYQQQRRVAGRTPCLYSRQNCPYGAHSCRVCGKIGHGAADCQQPQPGGEADDPSDTAPEPPPPPEPDATDISPPPPPPEPLAATPTVENEVPGFGRKGEGKGARYGVWIPSPTVLRPDEYPAALREPHGSSSSRMVQPLPLFAAVPPPVRAKREHIEEWIRTEFTPLVNLCTTNPPRIGDEVLWRGVKKNKNGKWSTKLEHFNGTVRGVGIEDGKPVVYLN